ncbi:MAG TPA: right-handed parallel beta-helix repeat-containing protein, partial [Polyangiaceae bacterium]|nr:right-handed parallel beta-helix repeat-containing protein [Polyangiaceae bacterium]
MHSRNPWLAALTSLSFAVAWTQPGFSAEYYASPSGSGDGSLGSPFSLFQAANTAQAGDTVYLRGGVYSGTLRPANSGTSGAWITFAAYPGELPIFDGGGSGGTGVGSSSAQYIRFIGIVARNFSSTGFGNGWTSSSCSPLSNGNLEFINVIAEGNGINGIAFYCASGVVIERSIVAHNGNQQPSWSSGVNLFSVKGTAANNIVRQTVSFENIDISSNRTDGSGFILDQGSSGATFENNIGFRNGGSCIRLTNSGNSNLINNTCFNNGIDPNVLYHDEIFYSDANSRVGALIRNTVAVASSGNDALWGATGVTLEDNVFIDNAGPADFFVSTSDLLDFRLTSGSSQLIDQGSGSAPATDVGFDPACLRPLGGQAVSWWHYAVDYDYIESIGGVAACFEPGARSGAPDIGAYEFAAGSDGTTSTTSTATTSTSATLTSATLTSATADATVTSTTATSGSTTATTSSTSGTTSSDAAATTDGGTGTGGGAGVGGTSSAGGAAATDTSAGGATSTDAATADAATADAATASATSASATSGAVGGTGGAGGVGGTASSVGGAGSDGAPASTSASGTSDTGSTSALTTAGLTTTGGPGGVDSTCQLPL